MISTVNPADVCFWALDTPCTHQAIGFLSELSGLPDRSRLETRLWAAVEHYPKMKQYFLGTNRPSWQDDSEFSLSNHYCWVELSEEQDVLVEAARWFSSGLDKEKPLWKMVVLATHHPEQKPLMLFMVHHAFCDGMSGIALFYSLCDKERLPKKNTLLDVSPALRRSPKWGVSQFHKSALRLLGDALLPRPRSKLNGPTTAQRNIATVRLPLGQLNAVREHYSLSMNDLFLVLVARAVQLHELATGGSLSDANVLLPVNQRQTEDPKQLGNRLTAVRVPLPVSNTNLQDQVEQVRTTITRLKHNGSFGAYAIMASVAARIPMIIRRPLLAAAARKLNFICTSAPGARKVRYIAGAEITASYGLPALMHYQGIAYAFVRYCDEVCAAVVSDPSLVNDSESLSNGLQNALDELESAIATQSAASNIRAQIHQ